MPFVRPIFLSPTLSPASAARVLLLAEGFVEGMRGSFFSACTTAVEKLLSITPFNTARSQGWLSVFAHFTASSQPGPAPWDAPRDTAFRSRFDPGKRVLTVDPDAVAEALAALEVADPSGSGASRPASQLWPAGEAAVPALIAVFLPPALESQPLSCECEWSPDPAGTSPAQVRFVATSTDAGFEWILARELGRAFGLGDEWEAAGPGFTAPSLGATMQLSAFRNLTTFLDPSSAQGPGFDWWDEESPAQRRNPPAPAPHPGDPATPDLSLPATPFTDPFLQVVEGGGGYRTLVRRPARDCLMRRQVGGALSPKLHPAPFCVLCRRLLTRTFAG